MKPALRAGRSPGPGSPIMTMSSPRAGWPGIRRTGGTGAVFSWWIGAIHLFKHLHFTDLTSLVSAGDVLVVNESRVLPVRLLGKKPTGAPAEILLLRPASMAKEEAGACPGGENVWEALVRPGGKLKPGRRVEISSS